MFQVYCSVADPAPLLKLAKDYGINTVPEFTCIIFNSLGTPITNYFSSPLANKVRGDRLEKREDGRVVLVLSSRVVMGMHLELRSLGYIHDGPYQMEIVMGRSDCDVFPIACNIDIELKSAALE